MNLEFQKFQANGNDFVMVLDLQHQVELSVKQISRICDRHFGIGADGLMLLRSSADFDFEMNFYNSDGLPAEMCGNGGRCMAAIAFNEGIASEEMIFKASDGIHKAVINREIKPNQIFDVSLMMIDVETVEVYPDGYFLNTGVPHFVKFVDDIVSFDVLGEGRKIRESIRFSPAGTNVNFVSMHNGRLVVRTYERGVENETLSCGTGVTASSIAAFLKTGVQSLPIHTHGGDFKVNFEPKGDSFTNIWLRGPAGKVFEGEMVV